MPRSPLRVSRTYWANCWGQRLAQAEALAQDLDLLGRDQAVAGQVLGRVAWQHPEQEEVEHQHEGQAEGGPDELGAEPALAGAGTERPGGGGRHPGRPLLAFVLA